jgi:hypothetical protein
VGNLKPWAKGRSGNPGGRPRGFASAIRQVTGNGTALVAFGWKLVGNSKAPWSVRLEPAKWLADRGWGRVPQQAETGATGGLIVNIVRSGGPQPPKPVEGRREPAGPAAAPGDRPIALPAPAAESREALRDEWLRYLGEDERRIVEILIKAHPNALERDAVAEAVGFRRSTVDMYLGRLVSRHFVTSEGRSAVRAAPELF